MTLQKRPFGLLSGNMLKCIAACSMLLDHIGYFLFPQYDILRILGRPAFPIFAFMISEGCRYTKNKKRYFLTVFLLASLLQLICYFAIGMTDLISLMGFAIGILLVYALQFWKHQLFMPNIPLWKKAVSILPLVLGVVSTAILCKYVYLDYGFWGCTMMLFPSLVDSSDANAPQWLRKADRLWIRVLWMLPPMLLLIQESVSLQIWSLVALPLLFLYSGKRGKRPMKYFFYIFYPAHVGILALLSMVL
ncbi:MAG: hypothetical protein J6K84_03075 [Oscillospiraceae bacterium]|nr:hypothetical protein [Oscillospiraceae bacterium]